MSNIKFKKGKIKYITQEGFKERMSYTIGDYSYGKYNFFYAVTHNPSGKLILGNLLKISEAKELTFTLSLLSTKWDGKKKIPKKFLSQVGKIREKYLRRL